MSKERLDVRLLWAWLIAVPKCLSPVFPSALKTLTCNSQSASFNLKIGHINLAGLHNSMLHVISTECFQSIESILGAKRACVCKH